MNATIKLCTIHQIFPGDLLASRCLNPEKLKEVRARNELERRGKYIDSLESQIGSTHPDLVQLVKKCLHSLPNQRPSTEELLTRLQEMRVGMEGRYGGPIKLDLVRLRLTKELEIQNERVKELTQQQVYLHIRT